jgi:hypothetical protein
MSQMAPFLLNTKEILHVLSLNSIKEIMKEQTLMSNFINSLLQKLLAQDGGVLPEQRGQTHPVQK